MQEIIFKPKYTRGLFFGMILFAGVSAYFLWQYFSSRDQGVEMLLFAAFFATPLVILPLVLIKEIRLESRSFTIVKFMLPPRSIRYDEVSAITPQGIVTSRGSISTSVMENGQEIQARMEKLMHAQKMTGSRLQHNPEVGTNLFRKAAWPAAIIAIALLTASMMIWPVGNSTLMGFRFVLLYIPVLVLVYQFLKRRNKGK